MAITAADVKKLREATGVAMMDCKKALTEADGDFDKAVALLREKGIAVSAKRADKTASEGIIYFYEEGNKASLVELNCETSFVAKNDEFVALADGIAKTAIANDAADIDALKATNVAGTNDTIANAITDIMAKIGEKIDCPRFVKCEAADNQVIAGYIHLDKLTGVIVKLEGDNNDVVKSDEAIALGRDIAMHIAWSAPKYLSKSEVPASEVEAEKEIQINKLKNDPKNANKPENILQGIIMGRINKEFYANLCLEEQPFVKDDKMSVGKVVAEFGKSKGCNIKVASYVRFRVGEKA